MNVDTGQFYSGAALFAAIKRGEPIEDLTLRDSIDDKTPEEQEQIVARTRELIKVNWCKKKAHK